MDRVGSLKGTKWGLGCLRSCHRESAEFGEGEFDPKVFSEDLGQESDVV